MNIYVAQKVQRRAPSGKALGTYRTEKRKIEDVKILENRTNDILVEYTVKRFVDLPPTTIRESIWKSEITSVQGGKI